jgi:hypothetical protein
MSAVFILLVVSVAIGFALSAFTWRILVPSGVALAVLSAMVLNIEGFGTIPGIAIITVCLTTSQIGYLIGHVRSASRNNIAGQCQQKQRERSAVGNNL